MRRGLSFYVACDSDTEDGWGGVGERTDRNKEVQKEGRGVVIYRRVIRGEGVILARCTKQSKKEEVEKKRPQRGKETGGGEEHKAGQKRRAGTTAL